jgi:hypothetical protein
LQPRPHALHGGVDLGEDLVFGGVEQPIPRDDFRPFDEQGPELEVTVVRSLAFKRRLDELVELPVTLPGALEVNAPLLRRPLVMLTVQSLINSLNRASNAHFLAVVRSIIQRRSGLLG